jgi:hypothetical protein
MTSYIIFHMCNHVRVHTISDFGTFQAWNFGLGIPSLFEYCVCRFFPDANLFFINVVIWIRQIFFLWLWFVLAFNDMFIKTVHFNAREFLLFPLILLFLGLDKIHTQCDTKVILQCFFQRGLKHSFTQLSLKYI